MSTQTPDITRLMYTVPVSSASGGQTLPSDSANEILQIIIKPPSETDTYKIYIRDTVDDIEVFRRDDEVVGTFNEIFAPVIPWCGNYEVYITNASSDGNYKLRIIYR
jgi:hypothetical protein